MTQKQWIIEALTNNNYDKQKVYALYTDCKKETQLDFKLEDYKRNVRRVFESVSNGGIDLGDYDSDSVIRLEAQKQKLQDVNNVVRKTNREQYRIYNTLEEIYLEYIQALKEIDLTKFKIKELKPENHKYGILQISDTHFNELIYPSESNGNTYDFEVASRRLKKFVTEAIAIFRFKKITDVNIFITGDLINSSRRLGEKLAQCTSLVRASLLATYLLQQVIIELSKHFTITVSLVVGNESRISEEFEASDIQLSENYDYLIFHQLQVIFENTPVKFNMSKNNSQVITKIGDYNYLLIHGNQLKSQASIEKELAKIMQIYTYNGIQIKGIFYGHFHSANLGDITSRSSSLCGANGYSTNDLNYLSRSSQNIYFVNEDGSYNAMKIDLQNCENEGYQILDKLDRYDVRSVSKNNKVVIENLV